MSYPTAFAAPHLEAPTYHRQRVLLFLLHAAGGALCKLDLQKLLFLYVQESQKPHYSFVPYKFGCYSFLASDDTELLAKRGWLDLDRTHVRLRHSLAGRPWASESTERLEVSRWLNGNPQRGDLLIRAVYQQYPYYAIRSEMRERLLNETELARVRAATPVTVPGETLYTLGYEGMHFEAYANKLLENGIRLLCDVRRNPLSRKFGFSGKALSSLLPRLGVEYVHMPELGIASDERKNLDVDGARGRLFEDYRRHLPAQERPLSRLLELLRDHGRIALTCFELHAQDCHRHCISDRLASECGVKVVHL